MKIDTKIEHVVSLSNIQLVVLKYCLKFAIDNGGDIPAPVGKVDARELPETMLQIINERLHDISALVGLGKIKVN